MEIREVWIPEKEYFKKYQYKYPKYMIKIKGYIVLYEVKENYYYTLEEAVEKHKM